MIRKDNAHSIISDSTNIEDSSKIKENSLDDQTTVDDDDLLIESYLCGLTFEDLLISDLIQHLNQNGSDILVKPTKKRAIKRISI